MFVSAPAKVLVSGANGFIAAWICRTLLEQGYSVRGTVRSESKGIYFKQLFKEYGYKFELVVVPDIMKDGAFDIAVKGIDAVIHAAQPVTGDGKPNDVIFPAVRGTEVILKSIIEFGTKVRRVVLTSSVASVMQPHESGYVYTENDWNDFAPRMVEENGDATPGVLVYLASKVEQEKVAWDFVAKNKDSIKWDLVTILPTLVWGPSLQDPSAEVNTSQQILYTGIEQQKPSAELHERSSSWVDVRDTALAHVLALHKEEAGGERLLVSGGDASWQDIYDALHAVNPPLTGVPLGEPGVAPIEKHIISNEKAKKMLGIQFRSLSECTHDAVVSIRKLKESK